jgi:outer membrane protein TolC
MRISLKQRIAVALGLTVSLSASGCHFHGSPKFNNCNSGCGTTFEQIEYADVCQDPCGPPVSGDHLRTAAPLTNRNWQEQEPWPMTLEEAVEMALSGNKVLQKLGGRVLAAPAGTATAYDPALLETNPFNSAEAALSDFDAQFTGNISRDHIENKNLVPGINPITMMPDLVTASTQSDAANLRAGLSKYSANGSQFNVFSSSDYNVGSRFFGTPISFPSTWNTALQAEVRQPLARGAGSAVNRIAGPNPIAGSYNGVLIGRIRGDVALADFEAAVRDLTRDVEQAYWELYFAYRDLDVKTAAREAAFLTWEYSKRRADAGLDRPDDEALARQQFYQFEQQVTDALSGAGQGSLGVLGAERQMRRLLGLVNNDGRLIRPSTEPTIAPVLFDWEQAQDFALANRVELRRQKWVLRQRELELFAARKLNKWQVDLVGNYSTKGFGRDLFGNRTGVPEGGAFADLFNGELNDWGVGVEMRGPVGNRIGHLAVRNAELQLTREKAVLEEQQKQLLLDLNAAYTEVDRSYTAIRNAYNSRVASQAELEPKRQRAEKGEENVFFLLDAIRRAAQAESAFHRSVVAYNLALQDFVYTSGNLLEYYNIQLAEDVWDPMAITDAIRKNSQYRYGNVMTSQMDICPITDGPVDQQSDLNILRGPDHSGSMAPGATNAEPAAAGDHPERDQEQSPSDQQNQK